jgi:hypothetical protein
MEDIAVVVGKRTAQLQRNEKRFTIVNCEENAELIEQIKINRRQLSPRYCATHPEFNTGD